ncbi:(Lyso)-N-acylphosphatidylethanolamine lipase-like [Pecten maximus]|uniref:(Lyso)-N-acylphosphatidylethanolamine lipase-like n=1 Tax=Pecten maximus TaxID=6579 RepID=UPI0014590543|nr:(Lyso)-N-acylphosphatidylethanolamine lipase-like [Pecten maximus]XP_033733714.1 (Lyso)-N-acylphosphatidylethanolamine lipase-like [Pecten maximus]
MASATRGSSCSLRWRPTSNGMLEDTEKKILQCLSSKYESKFVNLPTKKYNIWTLMVNPDCTDTVPLVLLHGMGGGIGLWILNLDELAEDRTVYAIDVLGFGRSSRPGFSRNAGRAESKFVESIEEWRKQMELEEFILLGHSLGGFISTSYTIKYPDCVRHLILADPWGFPDKSEVREIPMKYRVIATIAKPFNPLAIMRVAGPWGPDLIKRFRGDLHEKFLGKLQDDTIYDYIYHCNARAPSGESAFRAMSDKLGRATNPMVERIQQVQNDIPITMIHGENSWIKRDASYQVKELRKESSVDIKVISDAGHHVYADEWDVFNQTVQKVCRRVKHSQLQDNSGNMSGSAKRLQQTSGQERRVEVIVESNL